MCKQHYNYRTDHSVFIRRHGLFLSATVPAVCTHTHLVEKSFFLLLLILTQGLCRVDLLLFLPPPLLGVLCLHVQGNLQGGGANGRVTQARPFPINAHFVSQRLPEGIYLLVQQLKQPWGEELVVLHGGLLGGAGRLRETAWQRYLKMYLIYI